MKRRIREGRVRGYMQFAKYLQRRAHESWTEQTGRKAREAAADQIVRRMLSLKL